MHGESQNLAISFRGCQMAQRSTTCVAPLGFNRRCGGFPQGGEPRDIPIAFAADEPPQQFWLYPCYSSDNRWIAFEAGAYIFVVNAEGGEAKRVVKGKRPCGAQTRRRAFIQTLSRAKIFRSGEYLFRLRRVLYRGYQSGSRLGVGAIFRLRFRATAE